MEYESRWKCTTSNIGVMDMSLIHKQRAVRESGEHVHLDGENERGTRGAE